MCSVRISRFSRALVVAIAPLLGACAMDKASAPALAGPSEFGLSITLTATPDVLERDGHSQAAVTVWARGPNGDALAGRRFAVSLSPVNGGTLSAQEVLTGPDGRGTVVYTAAEASVAVSRVTVLAVPVGDNFDNSRAQTLGIGLRGADAPRLDEFRVSPASPRQFETVTFDASLTTVDGISCGMLCSFTWTFGGEGVASGEVVTHRFQHPGTQVVTLVITGPGGVQTTVRRTLTVTEGVPPVAKFAISPANPAPGEQVFFTAVESTGAAGARVVGYAWDFGNGSVGEGVSASTTFDAPRTYVVVLTVTDSNGMKTSVAQEVTVKVPE